MPINSLDHSRLLNEFMQGNDFWLALTNAMDEIINPVIQAPIEALQKIRDPDVEAKFAYQTIKSMGFNISSLAFSDQEYSILMRTLGQFWQTRGASIAFVKYVSYIKNVELIYSDLWANSLDMPILQLTQDHGTELWNNGTWFPTSYFDILYSKIDFPNVDENLFRQFIMQLAPLHLVLRDLIGVEASTVQIYLTAIPLDRQRTTITAIPIT